MSDRLWAISSVKPRWMNTEWENNVGRFNAFVLFESEEEAHFAAYGFTEGEAVEFCQVSELEQLRGELVQTYDALASSQMKGAGLRQQNDDLQDELKSLKEQFTNSFNLDERNSGSIECAKQLLRVARGELTEPRFASAEVQEAAEEILKLRGELKQAKLDIDSINKSWLDIHREWEAAKAELATTNQENRLLRSGALMVENRQGAVLDVSPVNHVVTYGQKEKP